MQLFFRRHGYFFHLQLFLLTRIDLYVNIKKKEKEMLMDNNELPEILPTTKRQKTLLVFSSVFFALVLVAFAFYSIFTYSFFEAAMRELSEDPEIGESLGNGLGMAISLVFMLISGIANFGACAVGVSCSLPLYRLSQGRVRKIALAFLIVFVVTAVIVVAVTAGVIIANNSGAFSQDNAA